MSRSEFDRRKFNQLAAAALGGMAAGVVVGCGGAKTEAPSNVVADADMHLCRGLNECKEKGKGSNNTCRGQGNCATAKDHSCHGENDCKGQGGCGDTVGLNECKGKGGCEVPLMDAAWKTVRQRMEAKWKAANETFAPPPAKKA
jgi:hypothetical protein